MICPNCGASFQNSVRYCTRCGHPLGCADIRGSHWVPIAIMIGMTLTGLLVFWYTGSNTGNAAIGIPMAAALRS